MPIASIAVAAMLTGIPAPRPPAPAPAPYLVVVQHQGGTTYVAQNAQACYNIPNSDARSYCLAVGRRDASQCYNIQRADLRQQCLAEVGR